MPNSGMPVPPNITAISPVLLVITVQIRRPNTPGGGPFPREFPAIQEDAPNAT